MTERTILVWCPQCGGLLDAERDLCVYCGYTAEVPEAGLVCGGTGRALLAAEQRAGEAWAAGVKLAEEVLDAEWAGACAFAAGIRLAEELERAEREREEAWVELARIRKALVANSKAAHVSIARLRDATEGGE